MGRSMFSSDIVQSDSFLDLSDEAQLLYFRLGCEGTYGKIPGIKRIVRGYGCDMSALEELYQADYLFDCCGCCWVRHYWVNNTFKHPNNDYAMSMPEITGGAIGFEGVKFKSAFVLMNSEKPYSSLDEGSSYSVSSHIKSIPGPSPGAGTAPGEGACGEGETPTVNSAPCPECGVPCLVGKEGRRLHGECDEHGDFFIDPDTDEYVEGL